MSMHESIDTGAEALGIRRLYCKINETNVASIAMFEGCVAAISRAASHLS